MRVDWQADDQLRELGRELRVARVLAGRTQSQVARAIGSSHAQVSRIENARVRSVSVRQLCRFAAAVGMRVWVRAFPGGRRLIDTPQLALLTKLRGRSQAWACRTEVTMPIDGDLRAADAVLSNGQCTIVVEAITRLIDFQAQSRAALAKKRDLRADRLIMLVAATRANRRGLRETAEITSGSFPLRTDEILRALQAGEDPGGDGIVVL